MSLSRRAGWLGAVVVLVTVVLVVAVTGVHKQPAQAHPERGATAATQAASSGNAHASAPERSLARSQQPASQRAFGQKVAGTWVSAEFPGYAELRNIHADGTTFWSHNFEYGGGGGTFFHGAVFGTWEQTGRRTMRSIEIGFLYDGEGRHEQTGVVTTEFRFDKRFQSYTAEWVERLYTPDQDFNDRDAVPVDTFGGSFSAYRISVPDSMPDVPETSQRSSGKTALPRLQAPGPRR